MAEIRKRKKNKAKKLSPLMKLFCVAVICVSGWLMFSVTKEVVTTVRLRSQLSDAESKYAQVKAENEKLTDQKQKLQDPDYVESYARSNYNLSKQGEQIFYLPEDTSK